MSVRLVLMVLLSAVSLAACSTVAGVGEDLQKAGSVLKAESRKVAAGS